MSSRLFGLVNIDKNGSNDAIDNASQKALDIIVKEKMKSWNFLLSLKKGYISNKFNLKIFNFFEIKNFRFYNY